jgi:hypothetical protein
MPHLINMWHVALIVGQPIFLSGNQQSSGKTVCCIGALQEMGPHLSGYKPD